MVKNPPANAGNVRDAGLIPGSGKCPGGDHVNPLQCSSLENPTDRRAWWAAVHWVAQSQTTLKRLSMHTRYVLYRELQYIISYIILKYSIFSVAAYFFSLPFPTTINSEAEEFFSLFK